MQTIEKSSLLLSLKEAQEVTGLTVWQLRGLIATRQLPIV